MDHIPKICYYASSILIIFLYFEWDLIDLVTPFLIIFIAGPVYMFFLIALIASVVYAIKKFRVLRIKALYPLTACVIAILFFIYVPIVQLKVTIDFFTSKNQMENVVRMVESGILSPNVDHNKSLIHLPFGYRHLSKGGGDIVVDSNYIFFYTYRGILDNSSGYVYSKNKTNAGCDKIIDDVQMGENWRWISCT